MRCWVITSVIITIVSDTNTVVMTWSFSTEMSTMHAVEWCAFNRSLDSKASGSKKPWTMPTTQHYRPVLANENPGCMSWNDGRRWHSRQVRSQWSLKQQHSRHCYMSLPGARFLNQGPRPALRVKERFSGGHEHRPLLNSSAVILQTRGLKPYWWGPRGDQNPTGEQGTAGVDSLWKGAINHESLRTTGLVSILLDLLSYWCRWEWKQRLTGIPVEGSRLGRTAEHNVKSGILRRVQWSDAGAAAPHSRGGGH